ncbi:MAG TPA: hypothetical protein VNJ08_17730 [Bacteriovoracaceae bacterium]|nr:hypothetical protein [Bacteriovoracaceae bacterium]
MVSSFSHEKSNYHISFFYSLPTPALTPLPSKYTDLLNYVQRAPDQGDTNACLFVASTGAMELIANKKAGIRNPKPYGEYDLAESYIMHAPNHSYGKTWWETKVRKFNWGFGIHIDDWSFEAWTDTWINNNVWNFWNWDGMKKVPLPKVTTSLLFARGNKYSTYVLNKTHIQTVKEAIWKNKAPVMLNYNDDGYWHVVLIVGWNDNVPGECYQTPSSECNRDLGSFYVRDSMGVEIEVRDFDWLRVKGNAAILIKEDI